MGSPLLVANWKMNGDRAMASSFISALEEVPCDLLLCPPFTLMSTLAPLLKRSIALGGQDCSPSALGAHTGEIHASQLKDVGCSYVLVGHSECRARGDTHERIARKIERALEASLIPILCVGETEEQREKGQTEAILQEQLTSLGQEFHQDCVIAYEPVWAIGSGRTPAPSTVSHIHASIRRWCAHRCGADCAAQVRLLYGGSLTPQNAASFLQAPHVDGGLVGSASLSPHSFMLIARAAYAP